MQVHRMVRGKLLIPVHWGTFDLALHSWTEPVERVLAAAELHDVQVATPRIGESIEPATAAMLSRWWPDVPWKTAAEEPVVSSGLDGEPQAVTTGPQRGPVAARAARSSEAP